MEINHDIIEGMALALKQARHITVFTGAGISEESGIPTYRGDDGLWSKYDPARYADIGHFLHDPTYYWNFFQEVRYPLLKNAKPNKAHLVLAELESKVNLKSVLTQNIDGLHQEAGSTKVIELHGTSRVIRCIECSKEYSIDDAFEKAQCNNPPLCTDCKGLLRPAVIFFGEALNPDILQHAFDEAATCDFLLAIGSSMIVYPAAQIPMIAKQNGATLAIINKDATPYDSRADYLFHEKAGTVLAQLTGTGIYMFTKL
ncbi:MAG: hypothetical protein A2Y62_14725 [Candidatus Fischerbacteria bacterium RBG_13_37_8]|uniref:protein acetyllysine N-acetyltransferase n=1 Tax=Candidatus Fischerbacteria bacterium RBG_13_37_8 TaxID=1817863 RepID=A0A1F5VMR0_9BACT|nr:MAG: hypothetical protein A2Y62_14725 [Candidatus Fischerbacteria bacterium RBG_13_37_8]